MKLALALGSLITLLGLAPSTYAQNYVQRGCLDISQQLISTSVNAGKNYTTCLNNKREFTLYVYNSTGLEAAITLLGGTKETLVHISKGSSNTIFSIDPASREFKRWIEEGNAKPNHLLINEYKGEVGMLLNIQQNTPANSKPKF